jgi:hypothetical protein
MISTDLGHAKRSAGIVVQPTSGGVGMRVEGVLDELASRALLDAVEAARQAGEAVLVEVEVPDGLSRETIRNLAACASRGARLRFNRRR